MASCPVYIELDGHQFDYRHTFQLNEDIYHAYIHQCIFEQYGRILKKTLSCSILTFFILTIYAIPARADYEKPMVLQAKSILKPELLKNKNYSVQDRVRSDGLFNHYTVDSSLGTFEAGSTNDLKILVNEIAAIVDMKQVKTDDTAMAALQQSGQNTVTGVKNLFNYPQGTLEGPPPVWVACLAGLRERLARGGPPMQRTAGLSSLSVSPNQKGSLPLSMGSVCIPETKYCTNHIIWNKQIAEAATPVGSEVKGSNIELWVLGSLSKQATTELQKLGWKIHVGVGQQLLSELK